MVEIVTASDASPQMQGGQLTENFARRMSGLPDMGQEEQGRFQARGAEQATRDAQMEGIDSILSDREAQASEVEQSLRESGFADVAERFRRTSRRQSFNAARRGIAGGSAALEQQAATQATAQDEAAGVAEQSRLSALEQVLKARQQRDRLAGQVLQRDPFTAQAEAGQTAGIAQATADAARTQDAIRQMEALRNEADAASIGGIFNTLGTVGVGVGNIAAANARAGAGS